MGPDLVENRGCAGMLSVDQALENILGHINRLEEEECGLLDGLGQIAAEDIQADFNVPGWRSATRDGFAVKAADTANASRFKPRILRVTGEIAAGSSTESRVTEGTAVRIMTGAPLPPGADCVVQFEDTDEESRRNLPGNSRKETGIFVEGQAGQNISEAGEMLAKGTLIVRKGCVLGPGDLGVLASLGRTGIRVIRRPAAAIIPTGEELVNPGKPLSGAQIYSSVSLAIAAQVRRCGGIPRIMTIARDNRRSLFARIRQGLKSDLIITCGGSSAGDFDLVNKAMSEMGEILFRKVNMAPGRTFSFGLLRKNDNIGVPHFALAGNPSAGMINFEVMVRPAIIKMQGKTNIRPEIIEAVMEDPFRNKKRARCYLWADIRREGKGYSASLQRNAGEGILPSIASANGLVIIPEERMEIKAGDRVEAALLDWK